MAGPQAAYLSLCLSCYQRTWGGLEKCLSPMASTVAHLPGPRGAPVKVLHAVWRVASLHSPRACPTPAHPAWHGQPLWALSLCPSVSVRDLWASHGPWLFLHCPLSEERFLLF